MLISPSVEQSRQMIETSFLNSFRRFLLALLLPAILLNLESATYSSGGAPIFGIGVYPMERTTAGWLTGTCFRRSIGWRAAPVRGHS